MRKKKTKITLLDVIVGLLIIAVAVYLAYRVTVRLNYNWNWGVIPQYLFRYDQEKNRWVMNLLMQGLMTTIWLSVWGIILATMIGTVMGIFRISDSLFKRLIGWTYVELMRNIPPLVLVFIFYYFVSGQIMPVLGVDDFIRSRSESTQAVLSFFSVPPDLFTAFLSGVIRLPFFNLPMSQRLSGRGFSQLKKDSGKPHMPSGYRGGNKCVVLFYHRQYKGFCHHWLENLSTLSSTRP